MKKFKLTTCFAIIFMVSFMNSCSIEKRLHTGGYHVKLNKNTKSNIANIKEKSSAKSKYSLIESNEQFNRNSSINEEKSMSNLALDELNETGSRDHVDQINSNETLTFTPNETLDLNIRVDQESEKCDVITKVNGDEISAKVLEIEETKIKYKKCDNLDGPTYSLSVSEVFMVKYVNGTKDVFNAKKETQAETKVVKIETVESSKVEQPAESNSMSPLAVAGLVILILGFLLFLLVSILIGLVLLVIGLIFLIVGLTQN
ncbi:hypothetical protein [Brumimicrobium mesophilum]|uniref:hypothetical protein n=1 Tax=Brumimicrobium mesophilum TaxID=392717 RepID=UPI00131E6AA9|nr:hypothetical protein [Brumimicrobium mesophilum]